LHHTLDWDGGGGAFGENILIFSLFLNIKQNLIGTQGLMVDKKQIKSNESI
jgi:hypothetical protein